MPTDEVVDALDVTVIGDIILGDVSSSKYCCASFDWDPPCDLSGVGWYWKVGVYSCILDASNIDGTWLGRGGL